jgi:hypothetical protein
MLTHVHMVMCHMVVLAYLRRQWSLRGREGFGVFSPSRWACEAGFRRFRGDEMLNFLYTEGRKKWRGRGSEKHSTDAGHGGDRCYPDVCRLTLGAAWIEGGDKRYCGRATDAGVSVCRAWRQQGCEPRQRQTLSRVCRSSTRSHPSWTASDGATGTRACLRVTCLSVGLRARWS